MADPENHTLALLRELRVAMDAMNRGLNEKIDANHDDLKERIEKLRQLALERPRPLCSG
jgi:hypothetical protein